MALDITGKVGWHSGSVNVAPSQDADALAFITAANITDTTQKSAINTLVTQLKTYGIWTKMKALYPFVGGTASSHKFNLKDPRDLDAAYRLVFAGGWTHSSTGALPNGINAYADTKLNALSVLTLNNTHLSYYSRTNNSNLKPNLEGKTEIGAQLLALTTFSLSLYSYDLKSTVSMYQNANTVQNSETRSDVFGIGTRTSASSFKYVRNGVVQPNVITTSTGNLPNNNVYLACNGNASNRYEWSDRQSAFASIGDGLTDAEAANFYTAVQTFQTTLGRQVGVPIVADSDAQTFITAANITDTTQKSAINTLVTQLKTYGIWTKMKALYPFVGGTASSHKWNLKDPRDLDAAFRLQFNGGWTHSSTGALPNGTNGYANTFLIPSTSLTNNSTHLSYYSRTNIQSNQIEIGYIGSNPNRLSMELSYNGTFSSDQYNYNTGRVSVSNTDSTGYYITSRASSSVHKSYKNGVQLGTTNTGASGDISHINGEIYIGTPNKVGGVIEWFSSKQTAFASIGDGLTDTEAANFYTAVQTFQTTLGRQI
jgi:hypothetical protein